MIAAGFVGSAVAAIIADKTKLFEEISKICYGLAAISASIFSIVSLYIYLNTFIHLRCFSKKFTCTVQCKVCMHSHCTGLIVLAVAVYRVKCACTRIVQGKICMH